MEVSSAVIGSGAQVTMVATVHNASGIQTYTDTQTDRDSLLYREITFEVYVLANWKPTRYVINLINIS